MRIFRHEVPVDDRAHVFELHGDPLAVACRRTNTVEFWALHDDDGPGLKRWFRVAGTGQPVEPRRGRRLHWGTAVAPGGQLVWHLVEVWR